LVSRDFCSSQIRQLFYTMAAANKASKKRPAASQAGPKAKKAYLEKPGKADKKRSRPVTAPVVASASASDSEDDLDDLEVDVGGDDEWLDEDEAQDDPMDEDVPPDTAPEVPAQPKDPNGLSC
jgi:pumilio family protein 6